MIKKILNTSAATLCFTLIILLLTILVLDINISFKEILYYFGLQALILLEFLFIYIAIYEK